MKFRVLSDLHIDVNSKYKISWDDKDILTIIAGDVAGSLSDTKKFLRDKFNNVIFIAGNHLVYNDENMPIQILYQDLKDEFPIDSKIAFLQDDYKIIDDTVFIGATLWTDYAYNPGILPKDVSVKKIIQVNMEVASECMNDYRWGLYLDEKRKIVPLTPKHCAGFFAKSLKFIKKTYDKFAGGAKKIVLIVHHGVSPKVLGLGYTCDEIAAFYISDLEDFISAQLPDLSLIIHGHIHISCAYKIGKIPVLCNARGYENMGKKNTNFNKDLILEI
ncbi:MAG: metallophosphoesterase [Elusimicrobiota bacterium]|jgi:predicted phosphodiesterase|nr:metallophosphoesterase [Elusimicrobiota bacterium]